MRNKTCLMKVFWLISLLFIGLQGFAQEATITGSVKDCDTGETLPGVTIQLKGTTTGTVTSIDGSFTLKANVGDAVIISSIGYATQEVVLSSGAPLQIALKSESVGLNDVVVIGYGTVKKKDATGSVTSVGSKDFNTGAIASPSELLMGKSAGVNITAPDGAPGSASQIRIRGGSSMSAKNDPLIVIDGLPVSNDGVSGSSNVLASINPNDIESFTVLKDASATAIYGSRASNGVIIITTKKGKEGKPFSVSYNGNVSVGTPTKQLDVLTGDEMRQVVSQRVDEGKIVPRAETILGSSNTDWQDEVFRTAISTDQNVSFTGSTKTMPYRASVGYTNQNGILEGSNMTRTSGTFGIDPTFFEKHLTVSLNGKGSYTKNDFTNTDAIGRALQFDPTQPIMNGNTRYGGYTAWTNLLSDGTQPINGDPNNIASHNPVASLEYRDNTSTVTRFIGNAQFDYKFHFLPELRANLNIGTDYTTGEGDDNTNSLASWSYREPAQNVKNYTQTRTNDLLDFYLNYVKEFGDHKVDATGGYSWQHFYNEGSNFSGPINPADAGAKTIEYKNENYLVSFFGRLNYTAYGRYLLTATVRQDGTSRFSEDTRWGTFPSVALAWKINEESFLKDVDAVSDMKLRLGYGITGQQDLQNDMNYPYIPVYQISTEGAYYQFGNTFYPTQRPDAYDEQIKWEETTTINAGLDFGFLRDRITGSIDVYQRTTEDLINNVPIPAGTNFSNYLTTNVGTLENNGIEFSLVGRPISTQSQSLEIGVNFAANKNEITKMTIVDDPEYTGFATGGISGGTGNNVQRMAVGQATNTFYLFKQVYDANGMPIEGLYVDKTGEGGNVSGNEANKYYVGSPAPDFLMGLSAKYSYKKFDASFAGRLSVGNMVYNNNASDKAIYQNLYNQSSYTSNILSDVSKTNFTTAQYWSDFYLEDASFFRMDNINFGYTFSKFFSEKLSGRVSFNVQNAFVITKYSGMDPEVANGIDNAQYQRPRTFVLGLSLNL